MSVADFLGRNCQPLGLGDANLGLNRAFWGEILSPFTKKVGKICSGYKKIAVYLYFSKNGQK